jgi:predicted RNase H-like HicB family nuclease
MPPRLLIHPQVTRSPEEATESAREALELYVEGQREDGRSLEMGIVRRKLPLPA